MGGRREGEGREKVSDGFRWFQMVSDGFRRFQMVSEGFRRFQKKRIKHLKLRKLFLTTNLTNLTNWYRLPTSCWVFRRFRNLKLETPCPLETP